MKKNTLLFAMLISTVIIAQDISEVKVKLDGFVKNDMFWDSRQTISAREGHFLLFPAPVKPDPDGNDINSGYHFNFLSIQSRVAVSASGAKFLNANVSARIEGDFFGQSNPNINLFRLRHAFIKMKWIKNELVIGQYWFPMFITECFPGTISFNTGVPFQPFGRAPQIRFTQHLGTAKIVVIANSQRDHASRGPLGPSGSYLSNTAIPEFSLQFFVKPSDAFFAGVGASYKSIEPAMEDNGYKTDVQVGGYNAFLVMRVNTKPITLKTQVIYGQNIPDQLSIGGIGVSDSCECGRVEAYSTFNTFSTWLDISTNRKKWNAGLFAGYSKNLGANEEIIGPVYGLATDVESMYRISPRVSFKLNKLLFAMEVEYTSAQYGAARDEYGVPTELTKADNLRFLFSSVFFF